MFLTDDPIQKLEDDELGRVAFVEELAQSLLSRRKTESLIVSLDGPWGSGKSSVLNLLETKINSLDPSTLLLNFDPWYFNSTEKLLQSFLNEIESVIKEGTPRNALRKEITKYKRMLTSVQISPKVSFMGIELSMGNLDIDLENPEKVRRRIRELIIDAKVRVIILIDNLDRLDLSELLLIFKLIRLCSDFPGFTFVLAIDKRQIIESLKSGNISTEFIEKIIQVDIKLPSTEQSRIDNFVFKGLNWIAETRKIKLDDFFWTRFSQIYQKAINTNLIITLRDAKRFLNTAYFSLPIVQGEVDYTDFLILQILRVFFPKVYEFLPNYKNELTMLEHVSFNNNWRQKETIAVFKELTEKIQSAGNTNIKVANEILSFLFPNYEAYLHNPQNPSSYSYSNENEKNQLIASNTHFDRYFTMRVAGDDIPTSLILEFVDRLNSEGNTLNIQEQFISKYQDTNNLIFALKKLDLYNEKLNVDAKIHLIKSMVNNSINFDTNRSNYWVSELTRVIKLVTSCILSFDERKQTEIILEIISSSPSLVFALLMARDGFLGRWFSFSEENKKAIVETSRARIHKDLIDENIDIFETYPRDFSSILGLWRSKEFLNEEDLSKNYLYKFLEKSPAYALKILSLYVWVTAGTEEPGRFDFGELSTAHDPKEIKYYLEKLDLTKLPLSERENFAVEEFLKLYDLKHTNSVDESLN